MDMNIRNGNINMNLTSEQLNNWKIDKLRQTFGQIFLSRSQTMKPQFNEYYQCSSSGYIKHENVPVSHLPMIREIPVASRCNEILPYKLHKIQVQHPTSLTSPRQSVKQVTLPTLQLPSKDVKRQASLNYSFSASLMQDPSKILQKDEVHSIHLDQNSNSTRIKTVQNSIDLTKSTYTTSRKYSPDMKRSLFSTNNSVLTHYTISKQKQNQKIQLIASQLKKQREKREEFEKKYQILFNLVNRAEEAQQTVTLKEASQNEQKYVENEELRKKKKKKSNMKKNYVRPNTQSSQQSEQQRSILKTSRKGHRKSSSPSPIVINIGSQMLQSKTNKQRQQKTVTSSQNEEQPHITQMKQGFYDIKRQVQILHENVEYLEKKLDEQQMRHQKEMLMQELNEKERKIEQVVKENQKMKEINDLLINKRVEPVQNQQFSILGFNVQKNSMGASFIISFLVILLVLNLRSAIC